MTKCFVDPPREQLMGLNYGYEPVRGIDCDPNAPACRHWRWTLDSKVTLDTVSVADMIQVYSKAELCCGNCYFCHEVKE